MIPNASPDAPNVDVYANGEEVLSDVPFGVISDYLEAPAGEYRIQVFAASPEPATEGAVIDAMLTFAAGTMTTVAATNDVATIEAQVIADTPAPVADQAQIRVVHLSADAPAVDIAPDGAEPIVAGLAYPTATDYLTVPAGDYDLEVRPAGTMDVALQLDPFTLVAGHSYSVFAIGSLAGGRVAPNFAVPLPGKTPFAHYAANGVSHLRHVTGSILSAEPTSAASSGSAVCSSCAAVRWLWISVVVHHGATPHRARRRRWRHRPLHVVACRRRPSSAVPQARHTRPRGRRPAAVRCTSHQTRGRPGRSGRVSSTPQWRHWRGPTRASSQASTSSRR